MKRMLMVGLAATLLLAAGGPAVADTVNLSNHQNYLHFTYVRVWADGQTGGTDENPLYLYPGIYSFTASGGTGSEGPLVPNWGFCVELSQYSSDGTYTVEDLANAPKPGIFVGPMGQDKADYIRELWYHHFDEVWLQGGDILWQADAFSAAVWEIVYQDYQSDATQYDVTSGYVDAYTGFECEFYEPDGYPDLNEQITGLANTWLHGLSGNGPYEHTLRGLTHGEYQDFVVQIPVPGAVLLGVVGLGLVGVGGWVVKRRAG